MKMLSLKTICFYVLYHVNPQNYQISISSSRPIVDSVDVLNMVQGTSFSLLGGDILHLLGYL